MAFNQDYNKEVFQCRSCKQNFHRSDVAVIQTERYGLEINEKACPHCGSRTYGLVDYPVDEIDLIYKSNKPSELKKHLDEIVEQIFKEDNFVREVNNERKMATV